MLSGGGELYAFVERVVCEGSAVPVEIFMFWFFCEVRLRVRGRDRMSGCKCTGFCRG